jgi:hypothetical protein
MVLALIGCYAKGQIKPLETEPLASHPGLYAGLFERPAIVIHQGSPVYTWYDLQRRLMMTSPEGTICITEGTPSPSLHSFNVLISDEKALYVVWRPKGEEIGWKYIIFRASYDGGKTLSEPAIINTGYGAMEPVMATNGKGTLYVAWYDERKGKFDIYMNVSHDYGKTWMKEDMRVNIEGKPGSTGSISQQVLASGDNAWVIWLDSIEKSDADEKPAQKSGKKSDPKKEKEGKKKKTLRLMIRSSHDDGRSWSEPYTLGERENFYDPKIMMVNDRLIILWCSNAPANIFEYIAKGIYSDDMGKTWQQIGNIPVISWMQFEIKTSVDSSGNIYMALAKRNAPKKGVDNIYFLMSSDRGETWSEPLRLQTNTPHHTFANIPEIASDSMGNVVVAWVDYRNIRGNIYANVSKDSGRSWLKEDIRLSTMDHNANLPRLAAAGDGRFYVTWIESHDDLFKDVYVKVKEVPVK